MTLIVAVPAQGGVVLASDSQITTGLVRSPGKKIQRLGQHSAWAAAGELALIQRVEETIGPVPVDQPLVALRDNLANTIKQAVTSLLQLDFRTPFVQGQGPDALLGLHQGDFVFVENRPNEQPRLLHITSNGTPEWIKGRAFASGSGAMFAYALLRKYHGVPFELEQASLLAYKVISEAIEVGSFGLGSPVAILQVTPTGLIELDEPRMAALSSTADDLKEVELRLLTGDVGRVLAALDEPAEPAAAGPPPVQPAIPLVAEPEVGAIQQPGNVA